MDENLRPLRPSEWNLLKENYTEAEIYIYRGSNFPTVDDWEKARKMGITDWEIFSKLKNGGFDSLQQYQEAETGGFDNKEEWLNATKAGFTNKSEYIADLVERREKLPEKSLDSSEISTKIDQEIESLLSENNSKNAEYFSAQMPKIMKGETTIPPSEIKSSSNFQIENEDRSGSTISTKFDDKNSQKILGFEQFSRDPTKQRLYFWLNALNTKSEFQLDEFQKIIQMPDLLEVEEFLENFPATDFGYQLVGTKLIFDIKNTKRAVQDSLESD